MRNVKALAPQFWSQDGGGGANRSFGSFDGKTARASTFCVVSGMAV